MPLPELAQDVVVTIIAMACALFVVRRVFAIVRPKKTSGPRPLTFVSSKRR